MKVEDSLKIAEEVKATRGRGRPKAVKQEVDTVGAKPLNGVSAAVSVGSFEAKPAVVDAKISEKFQFVPKDPQYKGWVKLTPEEAEQLGLAGKLLGHHPGLGIGLLVPGYKKE